jgi:hypothetical protein
MSTPPLITPPSPLKKKAAPLAQAIGKAKKVVPFVPFAGDPKANRPTKQQTKDEINAIRNSGVSDSTEGNWMNNPKVAKRTTGTI